MNEPADANRDHSPSHDPTELDQPATVENALKTVEAPLNQPDSNNPDSNSPELSGTDTAISAAPTPPNLPIGQFLDRLYGTLFLPDQTFTTIAETPDLNQGALVVGMVNSLEILRLGKGAAAIPFAVIGGWSGWVFFGVLLQQLARVFGVNISLAKILTLTGFASLPWLFIAPALSLPSPWRLWLALAAMLWFALWQIKAAAKAVGTTNAKLLLLIPLAVSGGVVALILVGNLIGLLISVSF
ncbi:MAG: Yip1 family protein [Pseudanabaena sp. ELA607]